MTPLRQRLRQREKLLTTFSIIPRVEIVELIGLAGYDAIILDTEHGPFGIGSLSELIVAARGQGIHPVVRVSKNDAVEIGSALDAGASGVLVPQIETAAAAAAAVSAARFAPEGKRGANPWVRAAAFSGDANWFAQANTDTAVVVMIEGRQGVANAAEIIATPGLDGVFLGPVDLSHALGVPGQIDHPLVVAKIDEVVSLARAKSMAVAVFAPTADGARKWFSLGVTMAAVGVDTGIILEGFKNVRNAAVS